MEIASANAVLSGNSVKGGASRSVSEKMLVEYFNYLSAINNTTYNVNVAIDQGTEKVQMLHINRAAFSSTHVQ